ncbi:MAG: signal peptidase I [Clostridia bacterium]|nr:signal peptidase I [Clostridia bacterium]
MSEKKFFDADAEEVEIEKVASAVAETAEKGAGAVAEAADNAVDTAEGAAAIADDAVDAAAEEAQDAVRTSEDMVDANRVWLNKLLDKEMEPAAETAEETEPGEPGESGRKKKVKSVGREILSWVLTIAIAFLAAIFINAYLFRISKVSGGSMDKTLHDGQTVFISRAPYFFSQPKYNDIVVFDRAQTHRNFFVEIKESLQYNVITLKFTKKSLEHKYWIKRVIGLPGDTIEIKEDGVYRNGVLLDETYVNPEEVPRYSTWIGRTWVIEEGEVFVMGDNRNHSTDSRVIGPIKINSILGKVIKK